MGIDIFLFGDEEKIIYFPRVVNSLVWVVIMNLLFLESPGSQGSWPVCCPPRSGQWLSRWSGNTVNRLRSFSRHYCCLSKLWGHCSRWLGGATWLEPPSHCGGRPVAARKTGRIYGYFYLNLSEYFGSDAEPSFGSSLRNLVLMRTFSVKWSLFSPHWSTKSSLQFVQLVRHEHEKKVWQFL